MRVRVERLELIGADRVIELTGGLNIVTGPMASGKTTLGKYIRFLLGQSLEGLPPEPRQVITAVSGQVLMGESRFQIMRPAVSTPTARVEIASADAALRLSATQSTEGPSYREWLLEQLELPRLEVPSAPTRVESEATPVTIGDYGLYNYLPQEDLGFAVFGHRDTFKNIKRKYVFEIVYGFYDVRTAQLQERLRDVLVALRQLRTEAQLFASFFEDTALENRSALEQELVALRRALAGIEDETGALAAASRLPPNVAELQSEVLNLQASGEELKARIAAEMASQRNLQALVAQLETQSDRLTRAIVADKHLSDIDFVVCPRCSAALTERKAEVVDVCYLCLQVPSASYSRESLVREQDTVAAQLTEGKDLLREREVTVGRLRNAFSEVEDQIREKRVELEFRTATYISAHGEEIAANAARRAQLRAREKQLGEYIAVLKKRDESEKRRAELAVERERLEEELARAGEHDTNARSRVLRLEEVFNEVLEAFRPPQFGEESVSTIDRTTFLPLYHGRRFEDLSSPGLATLVSVAYALAHQLASLELGLTLPNFLIIDGLSEHLGKEGLDPARLAAVYDYLIRLGKSSGEQLQVIVIDSEVPINARPFVRVELSEQDRLIPVAALSRSGAGG